MAEPQPAGIQEGDQAPSSIPTSVEDRKAAAALSNLDASADNDATIRQADTEALGKAMKGLDVSGGSADGVQASKRVVKVDPADVTMLSQQLDISKPRATELLKAHEADILKAISAWIRA